MVEFNWGLFNFESKSTKFGSFDCFVKFKNEIKSADVRKSVKLRLKMVGSVNLNAATLNCKQIIQFTMTATIMYDDNILREKIFTGFHSNWINCTECVNLYTANLNAYQQKNSADRPKTICLIGIFIMSDVA